MRPDSTPARAAIYVRVSTTGQEAGTSLDTQEAACRDFAGQHGLEVVRVFQETYTGVEYFDRPAMSELRALMRAKQVEHVVFYVVDRVSRGGIYAALLHREAREIGIQLFAASDRWVIPMDDAGELMMYLHGWQAGGEWRQIQERSTRARRARAGYGAIPTGKKPRYGYDWIDLERDGKVHRRAGYTLDETTSPIMREVFGWFAAGVSSRAIVRRLYERGVPSPAGKPRWSARTLTTLIADPIYKGEPVALKTRTDRLPGGGRQVTRLAGTPVPGAAPALVDAATWAAANARLATNKLEATRNAREPERFLLRAGFIRCGVCGRPLTTSGNRGYSRYRCSNGCGRVGIISEPLDRAIWDLVVERLSRPALVRAELEAQLADDPFVADLSRLEVQRREAGDAVDNLTAAIATATSAEAIGALVARLEVQAARRRELDEAARELVARRSDLDGLRSSLDHLEEWCGTVAANAAGLAYGEKRDLLRLLGVWVEVFSANGDGERYQVHADVDLGRFGASDCGALCSQNVSQYRLTLAF